MRRERDRRAAARQAVLLLCGFALACGFVYAARQQFTAVRLGYRSEELRRERDQLLAERQRLLSELEERRAPARLEPEAREMGLRPARPAQLGVATVAQEASRPAARTFVGSAATALSR